MIDIDPFYGILAFAITYVASRVINERRLRQLNAEEKARLLDAFSDYRIYSSAAVLSIPLAQIGLSRFRPELAWRLTPLFVALFACVLISVSVLTYRKLKHLQLPVAYIKGFLLSTLLQYVGIVLLFAPTIRRFKF